MSLNRYACRRDDNEREIISALEQAGCSVYQGDWCDLIVGRAGQNFMLEVKTERGRLTKSQQKLHDGWRGTISVVRDVPEALAAVGLL
ncbi:MAG TPA: hypothetical protein VFW88_06910 [Burkholderiales bacterium]|nr:hypothetical protein [Burkholderiales bacterium]